MAQRWPWQCRAPTRRLARRHLGSARSRAGRGAHPYASRCYNPLRCSSSLSSSITVPHQSRVSSQSCSHCRCRCRCCCRCPYTAPSPRDTTAPYEVLQPLMVRLLTPSHTPYCAPSRTPLRPENIVLCYIPLCSASPPSVLCYTQARTFRFELLLTPCRPADPAARWRDRHYQACTCTICVYVYIYTTATGHARAVRMACARRIRIWPRTVYMATPQGECHACTVCISPLGVWHCHRPSYALCTMHSMP